MAELIGQHGYPLLALIVFLEAVGMPIPAAVALLVAGASASHGPLGLFPVIATGMVAMMMGDLLMFTLGRLTGWWLLGILCRLSLNPESCILRSADSFYKQGRKILLVAKFLPGINTMSTPLAGSMNMRLAQFVPLDLIGIALYICTYALIGYLFSDFLGTIEKGYSTLGRTVAWLVGIAVSGWIGWRVRLYLQSRKEPPVRMLLPGDIGADDDYEILDVRSHGYYDRKSERIKGSRRLEPNALHSQISLVPRDKKILLYCTCVNEATALRVARALKELGFDPLVLSGGLKAWRKAGLPMEPVPADEVVLLPSFS